METGIKVCEAMTQKPVSISVDTRIDKAAELMAQEHVGSMLVKDAGRIVGIFTEQDVVRKCVAKGLQPWSVKARDVMETNLITVSPDEDVFEALSIMADYNVRHLPVKDKDKGIVGFITGKDILKIQPQLFELLTDRIHLREQEEKVRRFSR